ncbi:MAG: type IV pilus assembly protein PilM [Candidatus Obscuribacterales bacterium]|nr:type IV pilus assembly protein PilM [Candidatus Obscuribacterales bacterium]
MFSFGKRKGTVLGLDINSDSTTLIHLEKTKAGIEVAHFACQPTPPNCVRDGLVTDPFTMGALVADLIKESGVPTGGQSPILNVCVPAQAVVIRLMPVPVGMPAEELADVVTQEATNHVPFPIAEANLDWFQMNATERTDPDGVRRVDVILAAIQHSIVESYWRMADAAGVKLGKVEVSSLSVIRGLALAGYLGSSGHISMVVNIRQDATDINIVRSAMPLFGRSIILGVEALTEAVARSLDISFDQAMELLPEIPVFNITPTDTRMGQAGQVARAVFSDIGDEVLRSLDFYRSQVGDVKIDHILLSGPGCMLPNMHEFFASKLRSKTVLADPLRDMIVDERQITERMRPILAALIGSSIESTWNPSITVDMDLNKEGRIPLGLDQNRTQNIFEEVETVKAPRWFKPGLAASIGSTVVVFGSYLYLTLLDLPLTQSAIEKSTTSIAASRTDLTRLKKEKEENAVLLKRKALLDRLVGGIKHYSNYMDVVRENTPRGIQLTELNIGDEELKVDGAAVDFSAVGNLSVSLGTSPAISESNIEYASRPEKQPGIVAFSLKAKLNKSKPASEQSKPPAAPINTALIDSEVTRNE